MWIKKSPFFDKLVNVMQKTKLESEMDFHDTLPSAVASVPLFHEGYFVAEDKDFIYLSNKYNKKAIVVGIHKSDISNIELSVPKTTDEKLHYYINKTKTDYEN